MRKLLPSAPSLRCPAKRGRISGHFRGRGHTLLIADGTRRKCNFSGIINPASASLTQLANSSIDMEIGGKGQMTHGKGAQRRLKQSKQNWRQLQTTQTRISNASCKLLLSPPVEVAHCKWQVARCQPKTQHRRPKNDLKVSEKGADGDPRSLDISNS